MIHLNILVEHMGNSQLAFAVTRMLNTLAEDRVDLDGIVYVNTVAPTVLLPKFAIMQMAEAWSQPGITIATSCSTVRKMLGFSGSEQKFFYVWDLEWMRGKNRNYNMFAPIFQDPNLTLLARSRTHALAIKNAFNTPSRVCGDFNAEKLMKVIENG
jgi:hypothetical protein